MKINCLNCGKRIRVTELECICKYCGYYNRQAVENPKTSRQEYERNDEKRVESIKNHDALDTQRYERNDEKPVEGIKEKPSEFIMSRHAKTSLLIVVITLVFLVHLFGVLMLMIARNVQAKRADNGEVLEAQILSDSTGMLTLGSRTLELGDIEIVDWQYGGLPDGYQLIRLPFVLTETDYNEDDKYYYAYLNVGEHYIDNVSSYCLTNFAPEDYVETLGQDTMLYMVPVEYTSGELCIYVENEKEQYETKYVVPLVWE